MTAWGKPSRLRSLCLLLLVGAALVKLGSAVLGQPNRDHQVKAAAFYSLLEFTDWPASAFPAKDAPLLVAGSDQPAPATALAQARKRRTIG